MRCSAPVEAWAKLHPLEAQHLSVQKERQALCLACRLFGSTRIGGRLVTVGGRAEADHEWKPFERLAIDRFTGGGQDQRKFDEWVAWRPRIPVVILLEEPQDWEIGWLLWLLADVMRGSVTFGARGGVGHGWFTTAAATLTVGHMGARPAWAAEFEQPGAEGIFRTAACTWERPAGRWLSPEAALERVPAGLRATIARFRAAAIDSGQELLSKEAVATAGNLPVGVHQTQWDLYFA
jgi:hypothetical protein